MKYVDEFKDKNVVAEISRKISGLNVSANLMEVCGTHTMALFRHGIRGLLPRNIKLLSGPGCPVCVTSEADIDAMIGLCDVPDVIITTFGDMMKVPGSKGSLLEKRADGVDIRVVYSPLDALKIASEERSRPVIFLGVGFETTAPTVAATIIDAREKGLSNFYVYSAHKLIPPAIRALLNADDVRIDGFLLPGHVSVIIGSDAYDFILKDYGVPAVVAGFEPVDILSAIYGVLKHGKVENKYSRVVSKKGNIKAQKVMNEVFEVADADWRGFGVIKNSGLEIKKKYLRFNAKEKFEIRRPSGKKRKSSCICGEVLRGIKIPTDCRMFAKSCSPEKPKGPCMVSTEGACAAYYKYGRTK